MMRILFALTLAVVLSGALGAQAGDTRAVLASIDAIANTYADIAMKIWSFAEVGYQETRSSALLQEQLEDAGFTVSAGVAACESPGNASNSPTMPITSWPLLAWLRFRPRLSPPGDDVGRLAAA